MPGAYSLAGISPLGTLGLGGSGSFGSMYDAYMPSMMGTYGINPAMSGMMDPYGIASTYGMGGMMQYYTQMAQAQNQIEQMQVQHAQNMHQGMLDYQVGAHEASDKARLDISLTDGHIKQGLNNLYDKVREGDQDGVCEEFDKLESYIYNNYRASFKNRSGDINVHQAIANRIKELYSTIVTSQGLESLGDLDRDIKKYGDGAVMNGWMKGLRPGHHNRSTDETINHINGTRIDHVDEKNFGRAIARGAGTVVGVGEKGLLGFGIGASAFILGKATAKGIGKICGAKMSSNAWKLFGKGATTFKHAGRVGLVLAGAAMVADIIHRIHISSSKKES